MSGEVHSSGSPIVGDTDQLIRCYIVPTIYISLSTVVLNSRDWSEIIWLPENLCFKNQPCNRLYPKKTLWNAYNDAVSWLNEAKTQIFQPTATFEIFEVSSASLPAVRLSCTRCRAQEISHDKGNGGRFTKMLF